MRFKYFGPPLMTRGEYGVGVSGAELAPDDSVRTFDPDFGWVEMAPSVQAALEMGFEPILESRQDIIDWIRLQGVDEYALKAMAGLNAWDVPKTKIGRLLDAARAVLKKRPGCWAALRKAVQEWEGGDVE